MSEKKRMNSFLRNVFPQKGEPTPKKAGKIVRLAAAVVLLASIIVLIVYFRAQYIQQQAEEQRRLEHEAALKNTTVTEITTAPPTETETTTTPPPLVLLEDMKEFIDKNPDTAGWIKVPGTKIDDVVLQAEDNDKYIDTDFNGNKAQAGSLYADFRCTVNDYVQSENIVIYGHDQKDNTKFGSLDMYKVLKNNTDNFEFYKEHPTFEFNSLYERNTYKIIAVFVIETREDQNRSGKVFDYHNYVTFANKEHFDEYMKQVNDRTEINTGVDVEYGDRFVTLSTCSTEFSDSRFVVIGRKVRPGESPEVDTSKAELNDDVIEPDWNYIYNR